MTRSLDFRSVLVCFGLWSLREGLQVGDRLTSAAHGRPRLIQLADCSIESPDLNDFPPQHETKAQIFVAYVAVTDILSDLCQLWVRRKGEASVEDKDLISQRLQKVIASLPSKLCLYNASERSHLSFNLEVAQLHIQILSTMIILHRPKSIYALSEHHAAAIIAANISVQIFEAIRLRELLHSLSALFTWYLFVAAVPHLSCLKIREQKAQSDTVLDSIECFLSELASTRLAAATNRRNIQAIRKTVESSRAIDELRVEAAGVTYEHQSPSSGPIETDTATPALDLLVFYGPEVVKNTKMMAQVLRRHSAQREYRIPQNARAPESLAQEGFEEVTGTYTQPPGLPNTENSGMLAFTDGQPSYLESYDAHFLETLEDNAWMHEWIEGFQMGA